MIYLGQLDHLLLGCSDLQRGIDFVAEQAGVRAAFGGVHPGRGTQNALLSLGERQYLEIIAPDPNQSGPTWLGEDHDLWKMTTPRLITWAAHTSDIAALAGKLRASGVEFQGPTEGSRKRPDGKLLQWRTLTLAEYFGGLLPFFIQWSADSAHPASDSPHGCELLEFELRAPEPNKLSGLARILELGIPITAAQKARLRAMLRGPGGDTELTS